MRTSEFLYGGMYDKEFVQEHAQLFMRQAKWAEELAGLLMEEPLQTRDMFRVNKCLEASKWNRQKFAEAYDVEVME